MIDLVCNGCGKDMGTLRDAKIRNGMVVYCSLCDEQIQLMKAQHSPHNNSKHDIPDFMRSIFGKS